MKPIWKITLTIQEIKNTVSTTKLEFAYSYALATRAASFPPRYLVCSVCCSKVLVVLMVLIVEVGLLCLLVTPEAY